MWISKKKYADIMFKLNAASNWQRKYDECQRKLERSNKTKKEQIGSLQKELDRYKNLYLDELQKRLELADRVRELEGK